MINDNLSLLLLLLVILNGALAVFSTMRDRRRFRNAVFLMFFVLFSLVFVIHYLLIGAVSGMALNMVAMVRNIVYSRRDLKIFSGKGWPAIFAVIMGIMGLLSWQGWYSVFVVLGLVINSLCMAFKDPQKIRKSILVTSPLVLIYDAFALSVGGMIYESVAIVSALVGILRFRKEKTES